MLRDLKLWLTLALIIAIFIASAYFTQKYHDIIGSYIEGSGLIIGSAVYLAISIISTVIAPITTLPVITVIANTEGKLLAAILSTIGWAVGGLIAFLIARKYGKSIVAKFVSETELQRIERIIPKKPQRAFWTIVFLRIIIPTDVLSYALGLFSKIDTWTYFLATMLGVAPSAFVFAYTGALPVKYQLLIISSSVIAIVILLRYWIIRLKR
jgi:uncharacterized membrane protein YdjX (TVP38/TMEM64 family)